MGRLIRGLVAVALCLAILAPSAAWGLERDLVDRKKDPKGDEVLAGLKQKYRIVFSLYIPRWQPILLVRPLIRQSEPSEGAAAVTTNPSRRLQPRDDK
ncbi:MAG: hypothetical protein AB1752_07530 [Candidatus Zixiibacteriota bacterium]